MATDLVTKSEYKNYMGITSVNSDSEIDFLIPKVSDLVKSYCRRTFIDYFSDVKIEVFHTKKGSKVAKLIAKPKLQIDSRRYHYCYFDFKGTYLDQPVHIWECRMDNTFPAHYALIKIPKSVGKFASVGGENPAKINGKFQIVLSNKNAVGKKKITYTWNEKNGWFTGGNLG